MANFTRKAIMDACIKLLEKKPLNRITVRDIVEECGISRNSFYYHFEDVPSLLKAIIIERTDEIIEENAETASLLDCIRIASEFVKRDKKAMLNVYKHSDRELFEQSLMELCRHTVRRYSEVILRDLGSAAELRTLSDNDKALMERFLSSTLFGQMIDWLDHDMDYDIVRQFERYYELRQGMIGKQIEQHILKK